MAENVLVVGASGQLGTEITESLMTNGIASNVICADLKQSDAIRELGVTFESLDICDALRYADIIKKHNISQVYHLAAILSATGERNPQLAWDVNLTGYRNLLEIAKENRQISKIYFPSSIAVFGPTTPRVLTPQDCPISPTTMYGLTKYSGELLSQYYWLKHQVDVRSLRYPGIISYKTPPGGGTTDYAVDTYFHAARQESYECFLDKETELPMIYMPDALRATFELMEAPSDRIKVRTSYNLAAVSFTPEVQAKVIQSLVPSFSIYYKPDYRQAIADSWPMSIDDSAARKDWGWQHQYDLQAMSADMLHNLQLKNASIA